MQTEMEASGKQNKISHNGNKGSRETAAGQPCLHQPAERGTKPRFEQLAIASSAARAACSASVHRLPLASAGLRCCNKASDATSMTYEMEQALLKREPAVVDVEHQRMRLQKMQKWRFALNVALRTHAARFVREVRASIGGVACRSADLE